MSRDYSMSIDSEVLTHKIDYDPTWSFLSHDLIDYDLAGFIGDGITVADLLDHKSINTSHILYILENSGVLTNAQLTCAGLALAREFFKDIKCTSLLGNSICLAEAWRNTYQNACYCSDEHEMLTYRYRLLGLYNVLCYEEQLDRFKILIGVGKELCNIEYPPSLYEFGRLFDQMFFDPTIGALLQKSGSSINLEEALLQIVRHNIQTVITLD